MRINTDPFCPRLTFCYCLRPLPHAMTPPARLATLVSHLTFPCWFKSWRLNHLSTPHQSSQRFSRTEKIAVVSRPYIGKCGRGIFLRRFVQTPVHIWDRQRRPHPLHCYCLRNFVEKEIALCAGHRVTKAPLLDCLPAGRDNASTEQLTRSQHFCKKTKNPIETRR